MDQFFQLGPIPSNAMSGYYDLKLVLLSYLIAVFASYIALGIAQTLRLRPSKFIFWLLIGGAFAMGAGIFSMHFVGMLAFVMPMQMQYNFSLTVLSLFVAIGASAFALSFIKQSRIKYSQLIIAGIIFGIGIASMHYTGMAAMEGVKIHYLPGLFTLSIVIAITASIAALTLMLQTEKLTLFYQRIFKVISACVMGFAIVGMHYTGMFSAVFTPAIPQSAIAVESGIHLSPEKLAFLVSFVASSIMVVSLLISGYRHLILVKLLLGYIIIITLMFPTSYYIIENFKTINSSYEPLISSALSNEQSELTTLWRNNWNLIQDNYYVSILLLWTVFIFSILISIILSYQISKPIQKLRDVSKDVAEGNLNNRVDITTDDEVGELSASFNTMVDKLVDANKKKNEFLEMLAHDLRNPVSVIKEGAALLLSYDVDEKQKKILNLINKTSGSVLNLIEDLLVVNAIQGSALKINLKKTSLKKLGQSMIEFHKLLAEKKNIHLQVEFNIHNDIVFIDEDKIVQVMNNFISNAIKFSLPGSKIIVTITEGENRLRFEVKDEAGGIPYDEQKLVFSRLSKISVKPTGGETSHGLGLSICKEIIEAHGGNIGFTSIYGKGSIFYFDLVIDKYGHQIPSEKNKVSSK